MATTSPQPRWSCLLLQFSLAIALGVAIPGRYGTVLAAEGMVRVELADGRIVAGQLDHRTTAEDLWLVSETEGIRLQSRFPRRDIVRVLSGPAGLQAGMLWADALALPPPQAAPDALPPPLPIDASGTAGPIQQTVQRPVFDRPSVSEAGVQSLHIYAELANWDADVAADGLLVTIEPRDGLGRIVPVRGTIDLSLLGEVWPRGVRPDIRLKPGFHEFERTSHLLEPVHFTHGAAVVRLPFNHIHPDWDVQITPYGVVHARLGVPGQGVFEASDPFARLRAASPTRDRLQLHTGERFFRQER